MPSSTDCWGIEIGANAIKAIRLQTNGEQVVVVDHEVIPHKKVLTTPDTDADEQIRLSLDQFATKHPAGKSSVVVSVPGHKAFARFAKLPPVEPKRIPDIVRFEAVQQIPFPIDQVEWDYQTFQHADSPDVEVGIFAITKERINQWLANVHAVNIPVHGVTLSPVAIYNALSYDLRMNADSPGTILVDIGTSATDLIIVDGDRIWMRTFPLGGHQFTEALVRSFKLSYSKAEKLKREAATTQYARQIFQAMRPVFVDLVQDIDRSVAHYKQLNRDAQLTRLIGMGSTFNLPGLRKFIKQQMQVDVQKLEKFERIDVTGRNAAAFGANVISLAPAYGLALQGLEMERVTCNVLPSELLRAQMWKAKRPWMAAAAAIMVLSAGIGYGRIMSDRQAYAANDPVKQDIERIITNAQNQIKKWDKIEGSDPRPRIENIRRVVDYREVWPSVLADITEAMKTTNPQPALLEGNVDEVKKIPREQRNQVVIESIQAVYEFNGMSGIQLPTDRLVVEGADSSDIWGKYQAGGAPPAEAAPSASKKSSSKKAAEEEQPREDFTAAGSGARQEKHPPRFVVTMTGTTTRRDAGKFLNDTIIQWLINKEAQMAAADAAHLKDPAANPVGRDRPYRIIIEQEGPRKVLNYLAPLTAVDPTRPSFAPTSPTPPSEFAPQPTPPSESEPPRDVPGRAAPGRSAPGRPSPSDQPDASGRKEQVPTVQELLITNPLAGEDVRSDWKFTIQWVVELVRPETARQVSAANSQQPAPVTPPPTQPASPTQPAAAIESAKPLARVENQP